MKLSTLILCAGCLAWGNACETAASAVAGNWSSAAIWSNCGGGVPGNGDTALIQRPVKMDATTTVGHSPADTIGTITGPAVEIRQNSANTYGSLTIGSGVTWTMRGSVLLTSANTYHATLTMFSGSTLVLDASAAADPTTTIYRIYSNGWYPGIYIYGTSASHVTVRGKPAAGCPTCANGLAFDVQGANMTAAYDARWVDYYDLGCASCNGGNEKAAIGQVMYYDAGDYNIFSIQNATFTRTAGIRPEDYGSINLGTGVWRLYRVKSTSSLAPFLAISPSAAITTGERSIKECYFDTGLDHQFPNLWGFTVDHVVFDGQQFIDGGSHAAASYTNNLMRYVTVSGGSSTPVGNQYNTYYYVEAALDNGNSQGIGFKTESAASITVSSMIYEFGPGTNAEGTVASLDNATTRGDIDHLLVLPTAQNKTVPSGDFNMGNHPYRLTHSLIPVGTFVSGSAYYGEQSIGEAGKVDTVKSNIFVDFSGTNRGNGLTTAGHYSTAVANHFSPAGITNNTNWHYQAVSQWTNGNNANCNPCTSNGTPYDIATTGTVPGANDVNVDPTFVWQNEAILAPGIREWAISQHAKTYDVACGGVHTGCATAVNAFSVFSESSDVAATIDEFFTWLRGKWAPTNTALHNTAHDGGDIGPIPVGGGACADDLDIIYLSACGVPHAAEISFILGPRLKYQSAQNPWPGLDTNHHLDAEYIRTTPAKMPPVPGIDILGPKAIFTPGSTAVTCALAGTCSFNTVFNCNSTDYVISHFIVDGQTPHSGLDPYMVVSCADGDHMTVSWNYKSTAGAQTMVYGRATETEMAPWYSGGDNVNYYDVALANYNLGYGKNDAIYLREARTEADNFWKQPWMDEGRAGFSEPRMYGLAGIILRAVELQDAQMWTAIRSVVNAKYTQWMRTDLGDFQDIRNQAYVQTWVAILSVVDPDAGQRATWRTKALSSVTDIWAAYQHPDGSWRMDTGKSRSTVEEGGATVDVTLGNTTVTGHGTSWPTDSCGFINIGTDPKFYFFHTTSSSAGYLDVASDNTQTGVAYVRWTYHGGNGPDPCVKTDTPSFSGHGTYPYLDGLAMTSLVKTHEATADAQTLTTLTNAARWFLSNGYYTGGSYNGLFYARYMHECTEPTPQNNTPWVSNCYYTNASDARDLNSSTLTGLGYLYKLTGDTAYKNAGDLLTGAGLSGGYGGPNSDGTWGYFCIVPGGSCPGGGSNKWKDYAFTAGAGYAMTYPAYRLQGEPLPPGAPATISAGAEFRGAVVR